ncbi:hypothetical protein VTI74DRAFT_10452 [Chaetomium olivicolor]
MHHEELFPRSCPAQPMGRFTNFRRLPPEIRNMIWGYALPEARVYEVLDAPKAKQKTPAQHGLMFANVHTEPPPALAAVSRESRSFVLYHYKPLTLGKTTKFVDMSRDILLLEPYLLVKRLHRTLHFMSQIPLIRENSTRLALGTSYGIYPGIFHPVLGRKVSKNNMAKLLASLAKFPRLKTLIFVVHQEFQFEFEFRFPGTLTPMPNYSSLHPVPPSEPPNIAPGHGFLHGNGYPSPPASSNGTILPPSAFPNTTPTKTTTPAMGHGGLPSPAANTTTSLSPLPPSFPLSISLTQTVTSASHLTPPHLSPYHSPFPPIPQLQPRPQQVHQAYRFKFDIESNINFPPRPPHTNGLLYYPLDIQSDREDDHDHYLAAFAQDGGGGDSKVWERANGEEIDEDDEWCDPWPTNDDWRRFRRRWARAVVGASLQAQQAQDNRDGEGGFVEEGHGGGGRGDGRGCVAGSGSRSEKGLGGGEGKGKERLLRLPAFKLEGASLLWRYGRAVVSAR